jgi:oligopeptide/dipeptide ABC transporter ATP-binding protein
MSEALLELVGMSTELVIERSLQPVVRDVDLSVGRGEVVGLVGESGSGKSVTARSILRLLPAGARISGRVIFDGEEMPRSGKALRQLRAHRMSMIFQDPRAHVDPLYSNGDHLTSALRLHVGMSKSAATHRARELLKSVEIADPDRVLSAYPGQVSGGMLQRVMIAGALAGDPDLLIADEPTTALDVTIQAEILRIFDRLRQERGLSILFITHDLDVAATLCDRVIVMYAGRIMEEQSTRSLFESPLHPYTAGLLGARPRLDTRAEELLTIPGRPTSALEAPSGCPFHPRCAFAVDQCRDRCPEPTPYRVGGRSACLRTPELIEQLRLGEFSHA